MLISSGQFASVWEWSNPPDIARRPAGGDTAVMPLLPYDADDPPEPIGREEMERIRWLVRRLEHLDFGGGKAFVGPDGVGVAAADPPTIRGLITGQFLSSPPLYLFKQQYYDLGAEAWLDQPSGLVSDPGGGGVLAREANDNVNVPNGTRVSLFPLEDPLRWGFECPAAAPTPGFVQSSVGGSDAVPDGTWATMSGFQVTIPQNGIYVGLWQVYTDARLSVGVTSASVYYRLYVAASASILGGPNVMTLPNTGTGASWLETVTIMSEIFVGSAGQAIDLQTFKTATSFAHCNVGGDGGAIFSKIDVWQIA